MKFYQIANQVYNESQCPHFGADKNGEIYGNYVCNLRRENMQEEFSHIDTYCTSHNSRLGLGSFRKCPYYRS